jgi:hypothetical protein
LQLELRTHSHVRCKKIRFFYFVTMFCKNIIEAGAYELGFKCAFLPNTSYLLKNYLNSIDMVLSFFEVWEGMVQQMYIYRDTLFYWDITYRWFGLEEITGYKCTR